MEPVRSRAQERKPSSSITGNHEVDIIISSVCTARRQLPRKEPLTEEVGVGWGMGSKV